MPRSLARLASLLAPLALAPLAPLAHAGSGLLGVSDGGQVFAIDPATGETKWSYREPHTRRHEYSMRKDYGKGVGYA